MKKILMINNLDSTFIKKDYDMLQNKNVVYHVKPSIKNVLKMLNKAGKVDLIYAWWTNSRYAGWIGKLTQTPVVYVAGGFDTVKDKDIGYGVFQNPIYNIISRFNIKNAKKVFVVSENLKFNIIKNMSNVEESKIKVIPTGYDMNFWKEYRKDISKSIPSVSVVVNQYTNEKKFKKRCLVKGVDRYLEYVHKSNDKNNTLVGVNQDMLVKLYPMAKDLILSNKLVVFPMLNRKELMLVYNMSKKYCLFSRHEGLPNSMIEASLCGCDVEYSMEMNYLSDVKPYDLTIEKRAKSVQEELEKIVKVKKEQDIKKFMNRK